MSQKGADSDAIINANKALRDQMQSAGGFYDPYQTSLNSFNTNSLQPFQGAIQNWGAAPMTNLDTTEGVYNRMIQDPSARGYGADWENNQYGKLADITSGQNADFAHTASKNAAAQGMGNTGTAMRQIMENNRTNGQNLTTARNQVGIANAEAGRSDLWNATSALNATQAQRDQKQQQALSMEGNALGMQQGMFGQQLAGQQAKEGNIMNADQINNSSLPAVQYKNQPGFFGQMLNSFGNAFGAATGKILAPGGAATMMGGG